MRREVSEKELLARMKKPLVVINVYEKDNIGHWLRLGLQYDLVFLNYSTDEEFVDKLHRVEKIMERRKGGGIRFGWYNYERINKGKWRNIKWFLEHNTKLRHKWYWFPDPDLVIDKVTTVNGFLEFAMRNHFALCQPALTLNSKCSHSSLKMIPNSVYRETNFVEVMCPFFNQATLKDILWTFEESYSGYGIDLLWQKFVSEKKYVIDAFPVCHPWRPKFAERAKAMGWPDPNDELAEIRKRHGL